MSKTPTVEEAQQRLRIDADLAFDLPSAIEQAYAQALAFLDRDALYDTGVDLAAAVAAAQAAVDGATTEAETAQALADLARVNTGAVATPDMVSAQLLLIDVFVGSNSPQDRESKQLAAESMLRRHRRPGC